MALIDKLLEKDDHVFRPRLIPRQRIPHGLEWEDYTHQMNRRALYAKKNISVFFSYLFSTVFGGRPISPFKFDGEKALGGKFRRSYPDVVRKTKRTVEYVEVKASAVRTGKAHCAVRQFIEYCDLMLCDSERDPSKRLFSIPYVFFKYGFEKGGGGSMDLAGISNKGILKKLSNETRTMLILPQNLLILLFMASNKGVQNHTSSKGGGAEKYWFPSGKNLSLLREGINGNYKQAIARLFAQIPNSPDDYKKAAAEKFLMLDRLRAKRFYSGSWYCNASNRGSNLVIPVRQFEITQYTIGKNNSDYPLWFKNFRDNYQTILRDCLDLRVGPYKKAEAPF